MHAASYSDFWLIVVQASRPSTSRSIKKFFGGNVLRKSKRSVVSHLNIKYGANSPQYEEHQHSSIIAVTASWRSASPSAITSRLPQWAPSCAATTSTAKEWTEYHACLCAVAT